jgi:tetratricopeptide (TPR) repeat protein
LCIDNIPAPAFHGGMTGASEPVGTLDVALAHTARLLHANPGLAADQAAEILAVAPGHPLATLYLGIARRTAGDAPGALDALAPLANSLQNWAPAHYELALAQAAAGRGDDAIASLRRTLELDPEHPEAWRVLGDHLGATGDTAGADAAYARHVKASTRDPRLLEAAAALGAQNLPVAEKLLREHLRRHPTDVPAIRMLAEVAARIERYQDAESLLARCLELAPSFDAARHNYAVVLYRANRPEAALEQVDRLLATDARNPSYRNLKAAILGRLGDYDGAIALYGGVLAEYPRQPKVWMSYGHALKTAGRRADCEAAYLKSVELLPSLGEAWWSLANLKTFRFTPEHVAMLQAQLARTDLSTDDRLHFEFALGKALEDAERWEESFRHYAEGNRLRRTQIEYDADENARHVRRSKATLTRELFAARAGQGCLSPDPIFVVGLPRSGSTLVEQILSSHSLVEGTMELPDVLSIARSLTVRTAESPGGRYPEVLATLPSDRLRALGEEYLARTRVQRKSGAPFFIDKMPNNFAHVGLIHLMLPNAKIVDARRHPLGCCFSGFKQHFARGQNFTYELTELGRYYRDYVELMAHFDAVLPGRVHRVFYERMIDDTEGEVRRLLEYCGLPFEDACLRFYENDRAVRTASSEQVRRPIFRDAVEHWRHYEPWLGPLVNALGPVLERYPGIPDFGA